MSPVFLCKTTKDQPTKQSCGTGSCIEHTELSHLGMAVLHQMELAKPEKILFSCIGHTALLHLGMAILSKMELAKLEKILLSILDCRT